MVALLLLSIYADMADISGLNIRQEPIVVLLNHVAVVEVHLLLAAQSLINSCSIVIRIAILLLTLLVLVWNRIKVAIACNSLLILALFCINEFLKLLVWRRLDCIILLRFAG